MTENKDCSTLTHIAGMRVTVLGRVIQRCSLCGAKLRDSEGEVLMDQNDISQTEQDQKYHTWPVGRLVQIKVGNPTSYVLLSESDKLPLDSCIDFA